MYFQRYYFGLCVNLGFLRSRTQDEIRPVRDLLGEMLMKHKVGEGSRNRKRTRTVMQVWHLGKERRMVGRLGRKGAETLLRKFQLGSRGALELASQAQKSAIALQEWGCSATLAVPIGEGSPEVWPLWCKCGGWSRGRIAEVVRKLCPCSRRSEQHIFMALTPQEAVTYRGKKVGFGFASWLCYLAVPWP